MLSTTTDNLADRITHAVSSAFRFRGPLATRRTFTVIIIFIHVTARWTVAEITTVLLAAASSPRAVPVLW